MSETIVDRPGRLAETAPLAEQASERAHRPMAACLLVLLAGALLLGIASLVTRIGADATSTSALTSALTDSHAWRSGEAMRRIDRAIDVPYAAQLRRASAALHYKVLGDLGPQVREGCPGWLFYADGLRPAPSADAVAPAAALSAHVARLQKYADALRRDGKTLVVVTVPDKARVETKALCGLRQDERMTARWNGWRRALAQAGVGRVDLLGPLTAAHPAFYRTDVHWNARGAQAAADAVAAVVQPLFGKRGDLRYSAEHESGVHARVGDLLRLAGLGEVGDGWRPAPDIEMPETIRPEPAGGLLDDTPPAQILLAGSSFSRRSGFADRLGRALGRGVWNVSVDDGQFDRALAAIWAQRTAWPPGVRVVIWEMSEDALSAPGAIVPATTAGTAAPGSTQNNAQNNAPNNGH